MNALLTLTIGLVVLLFAPSAQGQDRARYRDYRLGNDLTSVAALAKVPARARRPSISAPASSRNWTGGSRT